MQLAGWAYAGVFASTCALTLFFTPLALRYAVHRDVLDRPNEIKAQRSPVPYLGGAAIVAAFAVAVLLGAVLRPPHTGLGELAVIMGLGIALAVMGLVDDLRGLSPWLRLGVEIAAGVAVWATPAKADIFHSGPADALVTVVWVVGLTNAFNLLDNMDGLSAGVAGIAAAFTFLMAAHNGQFLVAMLAVGLVGCAAGFLRSNFHPARIYMGDAGSLFLGFMLAVLALKLRFEDAPRIVGVLVPVLLLGVPLFDTTLVTTSRLRHGRSPLSGGRDHMSHRLVFVGIPVPVSVALVYAAAASLGWLALVTSRLPELTALLLGAWVAVVALGLFALLSAVPVYAESRRRHLMIQEVERHGGDQVDGAA
jgi:UDP-GlcNAc:undecaprenyl-phosphate GlcNAc-1-phosphate transferase